MKLPPSILDPKGSLANKSGARPRPSLLERLDDFLAPDRADFWNSFQKPKPPAVLPSEGHSSVEDLRAGLEELRASLAKQSITKQPAREAARRRKLILACVCVSFLILVLGAGMNFLWRQGARKAETGAGAAPIAEASAPANTQPRPEAAARDSGPSKTRPPSSPASQPRVESKPLTSAAYVPQKESKDEVRQRVPVAVVRLTPPAAPFAKEAAVKEVPPRAVSVPEVVSAVPNVPASKPPSGTEPESARAALAPAPQIPTPAQTLERTSNRPAGLPAESGRSVAQESGSVGASWTTEAGRGVKITQIAEDGPAARAGLKVGDIIAELDGIPVRMAQIVDAEIALHKPGSKIRVSYLRNGTRGEVSVTVGKRVTP